MSFGRGSDKREKITPVAEPKTGLQKSDSWQPRQTVMYNKVEGHYLLDKRSILICLEREALF